MQQVLVKAKGPIFWQKRLLGHSPAGPHIGAGLARRPYLAPLKNSCTPPVLALLTRLTIKRATASPERREGDEWEICQYEPPVAS